MTPPRRETASHHSSRSGRRSVRREAALTALIGEELGLVVALVPREGRDGPDRLTVGGATVVVDLDRLPLSDRSADLVTCVGVLEHLPSHRPVVREMARISAGRCIVSVPWDPWHRMGSVVRGEDLRQLGRAPGQVESFTPKSLIRALRRGFRDVELHPDLPWLVAECRGPRH